MAAANEGAQLPLRQLLLTLTLTLTLNLNLKPGTAAASAGAQLLRQLGTASPTARSPLPCTPPFTPPNHSLVERCDATAPRLPPELGQRLAPLPRTPPIPTSLPPGWLAGPPTLCSFESLALDCDRCEAPPVSPAQVLPPPAFNPPLVPPPVLN